MAVFPHGGGSMTRSTGEVKRVAEAGRDETAL